jgi:hypothetical protein
MAMRFLLPGGMGLLDPAVLGRPLVVTTIIAGDVPVKCSIIFRDAFSETTADEQDQCGVSGIPLHVKPLLLAEQK